MQCVLGLEINADLAHDGDPEASIESTETFIGEKNAGGAEG